MVKTKKKILIDTHFFLWIFIEPKRFSENARKFIEDTDANDFFLSYVSSWEASIKFGLGKLRLPKPPDVFIPERVRLAEYFHLPIELGHVLNVHTLPLIHRDPFDRLLISQAKSEDLIILTDDRKFKRYDIQTLGFSDIS